MSSPGYSPVGPRFFFFFKMPNIYGETGNLSFGREFIMGKIDLKLSMKVGEYELYFEMCYVEKS